MNRKSKTEQGRQRGLSDNKPDNEYVKRLLFVEVAQRVGTRVSYKGRKGNVSTRNKTYYNVKFDDVENGTRKGGYAAHELLVLDGDDEEIPMTEQEYLNGKVDITQQFATEQTVATKRKSSALASESPSDDPRLKYTRSTYTNSSGICENDSDNSISPSIDSQTVNLSVKMKPDTDMVSTDEADPFDIFQPDSGDLSI